MIIATGEHIPHWRKLISDTYFAHRMQVFRYNLVIG